MCAMESALCAVVAGAGLRARARPDGQAGVWASRDGEEWKKVASIGIAVRRWVSFHGFALNVDVDLAPFRAIRPCGLDGDHVSSLVALGVRVDNYAERAFTSLIAILKV